MPDDDGTWCNAPYVMVERKIGAAFPERTTTFYCNREPGHEGEHRGRRGARGAVWY